MFTCSRNVVHMVVSIHVFECHLCLLNIWTFMLVQITHIVMLSHKRCLMLWNLSIVAGAFLLVKHCSQDIGLHSPILKGIEANTCTLSQLFFLLFLYYLIFSIVSKTTYSCSAKHIDQQLTYEGQISKWMGERYACMQQYSLAFWIVWLTCKIEYHENLNLDAL